MRHLVLLSHLSKQESGYNWILFTQSAIFMTAGIALYFGISERGFHTVSIYSDAQFAVVDEALEKKLYWK